jgi:hypothetical protein
MIVNMTLEVTLTLPDGSASMDMTGGRGWVLPNGDWVKVFTMLELNDDRDLTYSEWTDMDCDVEEIVVSAEVADEAV